MDFFEYKESRAYCEGVALADLAKTYGTPLYIYSKATLDRHCSRLLEAFSAYPTLACFAVKANSNLSYLARVFENGFGADLVSRGELQRAVLAGVDSRKIVFSGVGKTAVEICEGIEAGILSFNVESAFELEQLQKIAAERNRVAPVALRLNPNIDAKTHPKIATGLHSTKFGISEDEARSLFKGIKQMPNVKLVGIACHIGSQITDLAPLAEAARRMAAVAAELREEGFELEFVNMGGGLGIRYQDESPPELEDYALCLIQHIAPTKLKLVIEPGRVLAGNTGILLTEVLGVKSTPKKNFVIVDASMTEIVRPAFYDSYHEICPVAEADATETVDIVGPVCESSDVLGRDRRLPKSEAGNLMYLRGCGAYGATMASNYNSRPRPAEVMVDGDQARLIRQREPINRLWDLEVDASK